MIILRILLDVALTLRASILAERCFEEGPVAERVCHTARGNAMGGREGSGHAALVFRKQASRKCEAPIPVGGFEIKWCEAGRSGVCYYLISKIQVCDALARAACNPIEASPHKWRVICANPGKWDVWHGWKHPHTWIGDPWCRRLHVGGWYGR